MYYQGDGKKLNKISKKEMIKKIISFMEENNSYKYKIAVGTDSVGSKKEVSFVTAVVVHRVGNGGRFFWKRKVIPNIYNLKNRIIQEAILSLKVGQEILAVLKTYKLPEFNFEIHVDIGEKGKTKEMISEVIKMVHSYQFEPFIKPNSFAASNVADRYA